MSCSPTARIVWRRCWRTSSRWSGRARRGGLDGLPGGAGPAGLWAILSFFDREPVLARVCVVQACAAVPAVLERREDILARLAGVVDEGRSESARARLSRR